MGAERRCIYAVLRRPHEKTVECVGGPVAQWSRATDCLSEGRQFKSGSARQHALLCIFSRLVPIRACALWANARFLVFLTGHPFVRATLASKARQLNLGHTVTYISVAVLRQVSYLRVLTMTVPRSILLKGKRWSLRNKAPPEPASPNGATNPTRIAPRKARRSPSVALAAWAAQVAHNERSPL